MSTPPKSLQFNNSGDCTKKQEHWPQNNNERPWNWPAAVTGESHRVSYAVNVKTTGWAILRFTALRLALFGFVWLLILLTTPLRGLLAAMVALLISGVISVVVLDRQRAAMGAVLAAFFGRINARIDASARAEDEADDTQRMSEHRGRSLSEGDQDTHSESVEKNE